MRCWSVLPIVAHVAHIACAAAPPPVTPGLAPPMPQPGSAGARGPEAQLDRGCEVAVRTRASALDDGRFELVAIAVNETERAITALLVYDCPGSAARFDGLPQRYDLGDRCRAGGCIGGARAQQHLSLAPGAASPVARATLDPRAGACNGPLPSGRYSLGATIALEGVASCSTSRAIIEVPSDVPAARPPEPPPPQAPPPEPREECPAMACAYTPCPPNVAPPTGCAAVCGCAGMALPPPPSIVPR
jgi:hypothetical protein